MFLPYQKYPCPFCRNACIISIQSLPLGQEARDNCNDYKKIKYYDKSAYYTEMPAQEEEALYV